MKSSHTLIHLNSNKEMSEIVSKAGCGSIFLLGSRELSKELLFLPVVDSNGQTSSQVVYTNADLSYPYFNVEDKKLICVTKGTETEPASLVCWDFDEDRSIFCYDVERFCSRLSISSEKLKKMHYFYYKDWIVFLSENFIYRLDIGDGEVYFENGNLEGDEMIIGSGKDIVAAFSPSLQKCTLFKVKSSRSWFSSTFDIPFRSDDEKMISPSIHFGHCFIIYEKRDRKINMCIDGRTRKRIICKGEHLIIASTMKSYLIEIYSGSTVTVFDEAKDFQRSEYTHMRDVLQSFITSKGCIVHYSNGSVNVRDYKDSLYLYSNPSQTKITTDGTANYILDEEARIVQRTRLREYSSYNFSSVDICNLSCFESCSQKVPIFSRSESKRISRKVFYFADAVN